MGYICDIINEFSKKSINHTSVKKCLNQHLNQGKRSIVTAICILLIYSYLYKIAQSIEH